MTNNQYLIDILWCDGTTTTEGRASEAKAIEQRKYLLMMDRARSVTMTALEKVEIEQ